MKCVVCKDQEATTKKFVQVDVDSSDRREPLLIQQIEACDECYEKIENGELSVTVKPRDPRP